MARFSAAHGQALLNYAYLISSERTTAEDLTQTVLLRLSRRGIDDLHDPLPYALRAITNECRDHHRRTSRSSRLQAALDAAPAQDHDSTDAISVRLTLWSALRHLPTRQRAAIVLRYYNDLPDEEIASILGCRPGTVRSLLSRGLEALRSIVQQEEA
jgi:RNA polymerase sigma factor (sigma-70 family)